MRTGSLNPMRWLLDRRDTDAYRVECTGFGINMVSCNCRAPAKLRFVAIVRLPQVVARCFATASVQAASQIQQRARSDIRCISRLCRGPAGNCEFPCLILVDDDEWWERYGGRVEANWEMERIRRYSSLDAAGIQALILDPGWSNEGLFRLPRRATTPRRTR